MKAKTSELVGRAIRISTSLRDHVGPELTRLLRIVRAEVEELEAMKRERNLAEGRAANADA